MTVTAFDPADGAEGRWRAQVESNLTVTGDGDSTSAMERLHFADSLDEAVNDAAFIQEDDPE